MNNSLNNNPINTCILQIDFSPILEIKNKIPRIQDELRKKGYPKYHSIQSTNVNLDEESKQPKFDKETNWVFISPTDSEQIIINKTQISYQVDKYSSFIDFLENYRQILKILSESIDLTQGTLLLKIGLRYVNCIEGENDFKKYIVKEYHGKQLSNSVNPLSNLLINNSIRGAIYLDDTTISNLLLRVYQNDLGLKTPNNIFKLKKEVPKKKSLITFLDIDQAIHFGDLKLTSLDQIFSYAQKLNDKSTQIFYESITDKAKEDWK